MLIFAELPTPLRLALDYRHRECLPLSQPLLVRVHGASPGTRPASAGWIPSIRTTGAAEAAFRANARRGAFRIEYRLRRHNGAYRWVIDAGGAAIRPEPGAFLGYVGSVIDIEERRESEERLRESEARFQAIANAVDQMIWSTRPDGYHDYFNDRWYSSRACRAGRRTGSGGTTCSIPTTANAPGGPGGAA